MAMEFKSIPQFTKGIDDRTVTGIFAVHGNVDSGGDRSWPGAFSDTKVNGRDRSVFLWQHNMHEPPVATIDYIKEVSRAELPESVLSYAPDATGGVEVARTYYENERAQGVFEAVEKGGLREMSYAFDLIQYDFEKEDDGKATVRNLRKVSLFDISDVNYGLNPATEGMKEIKRLLESSTSFDGHAGGVESVLAAFAERAAHMQEVRAKEGRVLSGANRKRIESLLTSLQTVSDDLAALLEATAPKADPDFVRTLFIDYQRLQAQLNGVYA